MTEPTQARSVFSILRFAVSWGCVVFAVLAVLFLGVIPPVLQPRLLHTLKECGRESPGVRLSYATPFYVQINHLAYNNSVFELSTDKVAADLSPLDWVHCRLGVLRMEGYRLDLNGNNPALKELSVDQRLHTLGMAMEDLAVFALSDRGYIRNGLLSVSSGDMHEDYRFNAFSQHEQGKWSFSCLTGEDSGNYSVNGLIGLDDGNGTVRFSGREQSPELWISYVSRLFDINLPADFSFQGGVEFESIWNLSKFGLTNWALLGEQSGADVVGNDFSVQLNRLSFGLSGYGSELPRFSFSAEAESLRYGNYRFEPFTFSLNRRMGHPLELQAESLVCDAFILKQVDLQLETDAALQPVSLKGNATLQGIPLQMTARNISANGADFLIKGTRIPLSLLQEPLKSFYTGELQGELFGSLHVTLEGDQVHVREGSFDLLKGAPATLKGRIGIQELQLSLTTASLQITPDSIRLHLAGTNLQDDSPFDLDQDLSPLWPTLCQAINAQYGLNLTR
ncbi:MAG: hypothetical protein JW739_01880 [Opitutales bacterium]|nr:hypothetical protein [Opitutales bacterium]